MTAEEFIEKKNEPAICPNCKKELERMPGHKIKCPFCKRFIFVRTDPKTKKKILVTEKGAKELEKEWQHYLGVNKWLSDLETFGISERDFDIEKSVLTKRFRQDPYPRDVIWGLFNKALNQAMRFSDLQKLGWIYYSMAIFLNEENRNPFQMLEQSRKMELLYYKNQELIERVEILADGCDECKKLNGKNYSFEKALKEMPLPNKKCTYKLDNGKFSFCRCSYLPVLDKVK